MRCFLDCGTGLGRGLRAFNKRLGLFNNLEWDIFTFEPNPHIHLPAIHPEIKNISRIGKAVWIENEKMPFGCQGRDPEAAPVDDEFTGEGSSLSGFGRPDQFDPNRRKLLWVESIDFSGFLEGIKGKYKEVVCKMDIEGSEIVVLDHCVERGTIGIIDSLFVEFHVRFQKKLLGLTKKEIIQKEIDLTKKYSKKIGRVEQWH